MVAGSCVVVPMFLLGGNPSNSALHVGFSRAKTRPKVSVERKSAARAVNMSALNSSAAPVTSQEVRVPTSARPPVRKAIGSLATKTTARVAGTATRPTTSLAKVSAAPSPTVPLTSAPPTTQFVAKTQEVAREIDVADVASIRPNIPVDAILAIEFTQKGSAPPSFRVSRTAGTACKTAKDYAACVVQLDIMSHSFSEHRIVDACDRCKERDGIFLLYVRGNEVERIAPGSNFFGPIDSAVEAAWMLPPEAQRRQISVRKSGTSFELDPDGTFECSSLSAHIITVSVDGSTKPGCAN